MGLLCQGQRHWDRVAILRADLSDVPAAPYARGICRYRNRSSYLPQDCGTTRRKNLGGVKAWRGIDVLVYDSLGRKVGAMNSRTIEILLVEDNPGDARLTREAFN